jgi:hypothetical protein
MGHASILKRSLWLIKRATRFQGLRAKRLPALPPQLLHERKIELKQSSDPRLGGSTSEVAAFAVGIKPEHRWQGPTNSLSPSQRMELMPSRLAMVRAMDKARQQGKDLGNWDTYVSDLLDLHEGNFATAAEGEVEAQG